MAAKRSSSSSIGQEGLAPDRREHTGLQVPSSRATGRPALTPDIVHTDRAVTSGAGKAPEAMDGGQLEEPRAALGEGRLGTQGVFHPFRDLQGGRASDLTSEPHGSCKQN